MAAKLGFDLSLAPQGRFMNTVHIRMPQTVASVLQLETVKRRARAASVTDVRFDYDRKTTSPRGHRITCSIAMAIFLVEELAACAAKARTQRNKALLADCEKGLAATFQAIDSADRRAPVTSHAPFLPTGVDRRADPRA
jgi:hypothetical protein